MKQLNVLLQTDYYKQMHFAMYTPGTTKIYSNLTPRKSRHAHINEIVVFGIQYFIKEYLITQWNENFFGRSWEVVSNEYKRIIDNTLGKDSIPMDHIKKLHDLGYLPLSIKALPEGVSCPMRVPILTITNTVDHAYWLVNFLETILSTTTWLPCTSATIAREYKRILTKYAQETADDTSFVQWQGHDFSMRGLSSLESSSVSGAAHLCSFTGTDSICAIPFLEAYYGANVDKELVGASVPASEHAIMSLDDKLGEMKTFERLLDLFPKGILSIVSDTWSLPKVVAEYLPLLKEKILARDGTLTIRPDSFWTDPVDCLCGWDGYHPKMDALNATEKETVRKGLIESLWDIFGGTINSKGYKVLNKKIFSIYGDSITMERAEQICIRLKAKGFASINTCLGIGSYTYQLQNRDVFGFAIKATYGVVNGEAREIAKDPVTDEGMKKSAKGLLRVDKVDGKYILIDQCTPEQEAGGELKEVFRDGVLLVDQKLSEIRERINKSL